MLSRFLSSYLHLFVFTQQGINRAFGFVSNNEADDVVESQTPMLFQLVNL